MFLKHKIKGNGVIYILLTNLSFSCLVTILLKSYLPHYFTGTGGDRAGDGDGKRGGDRGHDGVG